MFLTAVPTVAGPRTAATITIFFDVVCARCPSPLHQHTGVFSNENDSINTGIDRFLLFFFLRLLSLLLLSLLLLSLLFSLR